MGDNTFVVNMKVVGDISDARSNIDALQKSFSKLKLPDKIGDNLSKKIGEFYKEYDKYQKKVSEGIKTQGDYNQVEKSLNKMRNLYQEIGKEANKVTKLDLSELIDTDSGDFKKVIDDIKNTVESINKIKIDPKNLTSAFDQIKGVTKNAKIVGKDGLLGQLIGHLDTGEIDKAKQKLAELEAYAQKVKPRLTESGERAPGTLSADSYNSLVSALQVVSSAFDKAEADADPFIQKLKELQIQLEKDKAAASKDILGNANKFKEEAHNVDSVTESLKRLHEEEFNFNREAQNIDRQIQTYFGLSQMIRKVGDIARDAFATVKELDKAMTQTAVVTNFSVGDMWNMLPTYTAQANQLGSTIRDVYEAATLYYQQGLNTNQAMGLANETLKMARIAGLGAAEATDMMTAALRGFNMEINQQSAQKINDIYSELAAITASDTAEIGSAMERTASIANSANMEFATTSAFLAQMIETTREAPENLGTAMKTIVARFQEMKQDPTKLIDSEGIAMDANKVDKALKTIGVQLMDTKGEFRDLDDVFLDISSRWDSLTQGQQRYIATIAAGSRQQSRFIAMMSNYERTMELVDAANNSAGASQRQFEKTLDSMEAKLNKLKNAWDQFTMGLMNNQILKTGVDLLTGAFTIINKVIDTLGSIPSKPFEGITKSVLTLVTTLGMLQLGKRGSRGLTQGLFGWWKEGKSFTKTFAEGWAGPEGTKAIVKQSKYGDAIKASIISAKIPQTVQGEFQKGKVLATAVFNTGTKIIAVDNLINSAEISEDARAKAKEWWANYAAQIEAGKLDFDTGLVSLNSQLSTHQIPLTIKSDEIMSASKNIQQLGNNFTTAEQKIYKAGNALQMFGSRIGGPIGNMMVHIGNTMIMLGDQAIDLAKKVKKAAEATKGIDTLTGKGKAFGKEMFPGAEKALKIFSKIPAPLKLIAAALAVIGITWGVVAHQQKKAIEDATSAAAAASEAYDSAKQETSELSDAIEQIKTNENAFDGLVVGTAAFNEQLIQANQQITELLNKYPQLNNTEYLSTDKNGLMHISDAGFDMIKEYQKQRQANASALNLLQTADLNTVETTQKASRMRHLKFGESGTDESYKQRVEEANLLEQQVAAQKEVAKVTAVNTALVDKEINSRERISAIIADSYDTRKKEIQLQGESIHDLKQEYADFYGYRYDKSTKKISDIEGNEVEIDDSTIKDAVKEIRVIANIEADAKSLDNMINTIDTRFSKALGEGFEGSAHLFSDILSNNLNIDNDLVNNLLANPDKLNQAVRSLSEKEIAAVLGVSADAVADAPEKYKKELIDKVAQKAQNIAETQAKSYEELISMMAQTRFTDIAEIIDQNGKSWTQEQKHNKLLLEQHLEKISSENKLLMSRVGTALKNNMGTDAMKNYIGFMDDLYSEIAQHQFGNIDLNKREIQKNADGTISTVLGTSRTYGEAKIPIAFSPMLQTGTGKPVELNQATIDKYFDEVVRLTDGDASQMLKLDARGLYIDGQRIHGLIADIGDTAEDTALKMHQIEVDKAAVNEINNIFDKANLDTAIGRLDAFETLSNSSIDTVKELGDSLLNSTDSANLLGEAFEEFYDSSDFQDMTEHLDKFVDSSGKLNAASIQEMAKECNSLNKLLDTGAISAGGVAAALNALGSDGNLTILDLNANLLKFLSTANQLEDVLSEAHSLIENFDWGIDTGESKDFAIDSTKKWKELYEGGEFGNQQLENYAKFVLGQERWNDELKASGGNIEKALDKMSGDILRYSDGFMKTWREMADAGTYKEGEVGFHRGADNDIIWETQGKTTQELVEWLADTRNITQEWAKLMVEDFANYSYDFKTELAANDFAAGIDKYIPERTGQNGLINVTLSELQTLADAQGKTVDEIKSDLADKAGIDDEQLNVLRDIDENGQALLDEDSIEKLNEEKSKADLGNDTDKSWISQYQKINSQGKEVANTAELKSAISGAISDGLRSDTATEMARAEGLKALEEGTKVFYDGVELQKSDLEDAAAFADKIAEITDGAKWQQVGEAIAQGVINYLFKGGNKDNNNNNNTNTESTSKKDGGSGYQKNTIETTETITKTEVENKVVKADAEETPAFTKIYEYFANKDQDNFIFNVLTQGADGLVGISELFSGLKEKFSSPLQVTTTADTSGIKTVGTALGGIPKKKNISITATDNTGGVIASIGTKLANLAKKALNIGGGSAAGHNNTIPISHVPTFASAAKGKGRVGPKNKGGLTLTGEEGYEIAWLPSEGKSMIVGATGPQMLNLPSDAVVYTHKQSEDILKKRQTIEAGSHAGMRDTTSSSNGGGGKNKTSTKKKSKGKKSNSKKSSDKKKTKILYEQWKVDTLIYNTEKKIEAVTRTITKLQKQFAKALDKTGVSLQEITKLGGQRNAQIQQSINLNQQLVNKYKKQLSDLASGAEQLEISWTEKTLETKTTGTGKKKKTTTTEGTKSYTKTMSVGQFITQDATGAYVLNENALAAAFGNDKAKGEEVRKQIESKINEYTNGLYKAEDEITSLQEEYEEMLRDITDKFYSWETILTKVYNITSKIEEAEARQARRESQSSLYDARLMAGLETNSEEFRKLTYNTFKSTLDGAVDLINKNREKVIEQARELSEKISGQNILNKIQSINDQLGAINNVEVKSAAVTGLKNQKATAEAQIAAGKKANANLYSLYYNLYSKQNARANLQSILNDQYYWLGVDKKAMDKAKNKYGTSSKKYKNAKAEYKDTLSMTKEYETAVAQAVAQEQAAQRAVDEANAAISQGYIAEARLPKIITDLSTAQAEYEKALKQVEAMSGEGDVSQLKAALGLAKADLEAQYKNYQRMSQYLEVKQNEDGTIDLNILTDKLEQDKYAGKDGIDDKFKEELEKMVEEWKEGSKNISETINEIQSNIIDLTEQLTDLKEAYATYADDLLESYNDLKEEEIDELKNMSSSISDTFKDLFDKVRQNLEERRRIEDNAKTESDISKKQQQLAALRANTSGGNQVQIKQLEKEIAENQQSYQRTLEDQLLDKLQKSNDKAEEQRNQLIELTSGIYEINKNSGANADYIDLLLADPKKYQKELTELQKRNLGYDEKSHQRQELLDSELDKMAIDLDPNTGLPEQIISTKAALSSLNVILEQVKNGFNDILDLATNSQQENEENAEESTTHQAQAISYPETNDIPVVHESKASINNKYRQLLSQFAKTIDPHDINEEQFKSVAKLGRKADKSIEAIIEDIIERFPGFEEDKTILRLRLKSIARRNKYASGGLNKFTGPAWLDGTPSKPELVLNAQDTKNFIALKDILNRAISSSNMTNSSVGNATYEININVDNIANDYDVDKMADRIKKIIVKDSSYRNVTQVRNFR